MSERGGSPGAFAMPTAETRFAQRVRGDMADPNRQAAFAVFKRSLRDVWTEDFNDDLYLYRFFKAREFSPAKAEEMIRNHLNWRKQNRVDELLVKGFQEPEVITRYYPGGFCGVDKDGYPVWYEASGLIDPQGMARSAQREVLMRSRIYMCEKFARQILPRLREQTGLPIYSCTFVVDMQSFGRRHMWGPGLEFYAEFVRICEANYPETIGAAFVINAPAIFPIVFNLMKPWLHIETQKKIKVAGKNYKQLLLDAIDASELPKVYGGTKTDPNGDPSCSSLICWGGEIPKEYYLQPLFPGKLSAQSIGRRSKFKVELRVPREGLFIEWDFLTQDGDLGFQIVRVDQEVEHPFLTYRKVHSAICPCSGSVACPNPGWYTVHFDNSFSWVHSKRLSYFVHVTDKPLAGLVYDYVSDCGKGSDGDVDEDAAADEFERNLNALMDKETDGAFAE